MEPINICLRCRNKLQSINGLCSKCFETVRIREEIELRDIKKEVGERRGVLIDKIIEKLFSTEVPDKSLDALVGRYGIVADFLGYIPEDPQYGCLNYTGSIDAALTLADEDKQKLLRLALNSVGKKYNLHMCRWPSDKNYIAILACHICAIALEQKKQSSVQS